MNRFLSRRTLSAWVIGAACTLGLAGAVQASDEPADVFIKRVSSDILDAIKADKSIGNGDVNKIIVLVDRRVMPNVNFLRMTASAVGPGWRQATPEQQKRLQEEFKILLVRTYSGALGQVSDQAIVVKPLRAAPDDKEVIVKTVVLGRGDPVPLDYRLEKTSNGWKVYDMNIMGVWLVEAYRNQFANQISQNGIEGLVKFLQDRNKQLAAAKPAN